jgi:hypothetical protein
MVCSRAIPQLATSIRQFFDAVFARRFHNALRRRRSHAAVRPTYVHERHHRKERHRLVGESERLQVLQHFVVCHTDPL